MDLINYNQKNYLALQAKGNAAQFAVPYAKHLCKGLGIDVGCNRKEWMFPGAFPVDPVLNDYDALNFPYENLDYIFSSHCLEHIQNWVNVLDHWTIKLRSGGILFLYLPDYSQEYWRPWNNRKHLHIFTPEIISNYMKNNGYKNIFSSGIDLNCSFMVVGEKG